MRTEIRNHYENTPIQIYWKFDTKKNLKISDKKSDNVHISAQNIDCGYSLEPPRRGGSNGYPHSMFLSRNKKNNVYPCKSHFYYIKVGFKGVKITQACFRDVPEIKKILASFVIKHLIGDMRHAALEWNRKWEGCVQWMFRCQADSSMTSAS